MRNRIDAELIRLNPDMPLPGYATLGSAAIDLFANIPYDIVLFAGEKAQVGTGIKIWHQDPEWAGLILPRSGKGSEGLVLKNLVGLVDSDYQGELVVTAWNSNDSGSVTIPGYKSGKAFAQYVMVPVGRLFFDERTYFSNSTERGAGGFGSTDGKAKS